MGSQAAVLFRYAQCCDRRREEDETIILRIHECRGSHTSVTLCPTAEMAAYAPCNLLEETIAKKQNACKITSRLRPFEIQTFKIWVK